MRHDGQWYYRELEPGSTVTNLIKNYHTSTGVELSKIRYTCDEFPPASWVEGGNGEDRDQPANTRCAAMRCAEGVKAEQDCKWCFSRVPRHNLGTSEQGWPSCP